MKPPYIQYSTAGTGSTITLTDTQDEIQLIHEAALVATLTIAFPATPINGQRVYITSVGGVTALTLTSAVGTFASLLTTLASGGKSCFMYLAATTKWYIV